MENPFALLNSKLDQILSSQAAILKMQSEILEKLDKPKPAWESLDVAKATRHVGKDKLLAWAQAGKVRHEYGLRVAVVSGPISLVARI
jgi:hypothetical protein